MGEGTSAAQPEVLVARAQVLAAREASLDEELVRLEASARAAVDIPAKVRRNPVKTAGVAAGAGFLAVGGPKRVFRRAQLRGVRGAGGAAPDSRMLAQGDRRGARLARHGRRRSAG